MQREGYSARTTGIAAGRHPSALISGLILPAILIVGLVLLIIQRGPPGI